MFEIQKKAAGNKAYKVIQSTESYTDSVSILKDAQKELEKGDRIRIQYRDSKTKNSITKSYGSNDEINLTENLPVPSNENFGGIAEKMEKEIEEELDDEELEELKAEVERNIDRGENKAVSNGIDLTALSYEDAWDLAIDSVSYDVKIADAFFWNEEKEEPVKAKKKTRTGRESSYRFVVVDPTRTGEFNPLTIVTDRYRAPYLPDYYSRLKEDGENIEGIEIRPTFAYVSGDGSQQFMILSVEGMDSPTDRKMKMNFFFRSSLDGTIAHNFRIVAETTNGTMIPLGEAESLKTKHTKNIGDRLSDFHQNIYELFNSWNDTIIPMIKLFTDSTHKEIKEYIESFIKDLNLGKRKEERFIEEVKTTSIFDAIEDIASKMEQESKSWESYFRDVEKFPAALNNLANKIQK